jgi:hypothetical protein
LFLTDGHGSINHQVDPYRWGLSKPFALCSDRDVHVIDVGSSSAGRGAFGDGDSISNVYVHLAAADAEANESRDVALVLHSAHPVRWILSSSSQLAGSLVILVTTAAHFSVCQQVAHFCDS